MNDTKKQNMKNIFMVVSSNVLTIVIALFTGFIIPKQLSVTDYAYYHIYLLYIAYAGFFHLGLVNGIYLKYGNLDVQQLPKEKFRGYTRIMMWIQTAVAAILAVGLAVMRYSIDEGTMIAYAFIIINIPLVNMKWFFSSINQFTKRFVIDSYVTFLQNLLNLLMVVIIVIMKWYDFRWLLVFTTANNTICMIIVMVQNRNLIFGTAKSGENSDIKALIRSGFFLMLSEFVGIIILGIDSIFVTNLFSLEDFAMYSFAVTIISVIYTLISTVSNLIYPYLVRVDDEKYSEYYNLMSNVLCVVAIFAILAFYVAKFIIVYWLDKYMAAIAITGILFGTVIFRSLIMLVCGNYFKVLKMIKEYTKNNIFAIVISFVLDVLAYLIFKDYIYIAIASLVSFIIWYLVTDYIFLKRLEIPMKMAMRRYAGVAVSLVVFYILLNGATIPAFCIYFVASIIICVVFFGPELKKVKQMILDRK